MNIFYIHLEEQDHTDKFQFWSLKCERDLKLQPDLEI